MVKKALLHMSEMSGKENNLQLCQLGIQRALIIRNILSHHVVSQQRSVENNIELLVKKMQMQILTPTETF